MDKWENGKRSIFRAEAVRHYLHSQQEEIFPRFGSPYAFPYLWILICLLIVSLCFTWLVQIPVLISGQAVVIESPASPLANNLALAIFLPPQYQNQLQEGQIVYVQSGLKGEPILQTIIAISPDVVSPLAASTVYGVEPGAVNEPITVVLADFNLAELTSIPTATYIGSQFSVQVEIGSRRLISLFP
ncbi:hypothetical protein [Candidatus Leptofilum sp.]|uniref:hypothetical protein n=1 Tax=Candidatus Leptofilum sp. TaxID=3241576 RepID=UPI003B594DB0